MKRRVLFRVKMPSLMPPGRSAVIAKNVGGSKMREDRDTLWRVMHLERK